MRATIAIVSLLFLTLAMASGQVPGLIKPIFVELPEVKQDRVAVNGASMTAGEFDAFLKREQEGFPGIAVVILQFDGRASFKDYFAFVSSASKVSDLLYLEKRQLNAAPTLISSPTRWQRSQNPRGEISIVRDPHPTKVIDEQATRLDLIQRGELRY